MSHYQKPPELYEGLRLHQNENTGGCSPRVIEALARLRPDQIGFYPPYAAATDAVSRYLGVPTEAITLVNGLDEGIMAVAVAFLRAAIGGPQLEAIVPARALTELARIGQGAEQIELGVHENQVVFGVDGIWLTTRRIDGQFPNYKQLIPESFEYEVALPRDEVLEVVRRIAVMAQRNSPLRLRFAEGELTVSARTQDVGEAQESLPAPFSGEPLEIGFNAEFLRDGIESVEADEVDLRLISPLRPGLIRSEEDDFQYLIMPIRLAG